MSKEWEPENPWRPDPPCYAPSQVFTDGVKAGQRTLLEYILKPTHGVKLGGNWVVHGDVIDELREALK